MILKGNQRGNGRELANHLMKGRENEHIELHDLRGFVADDLHGAMEENEAIARGTQCQKYLFSLSLNPPEHEDVPVEVFEAAIERIEGRLGLEGQPRAIVFHEKEGRRHAHAVWSRIDGEEMKAIKLEYYKLRLNEVARELYREHGWQMPDGFREKGQRDPLAFTLEEWQQAGRTKQDPKLTKNMIREGWTGSDSRESFEAALKNNGLWLARGDKRGFVAVDWRGETYSLTRMSGAKTQEIAARLGDPKDLLSVDEAKAQISAQLTPKLETWAKEEQARADKAGLAAQFQREQMVQRQRQAREKLKTQHEERWLAEEKRRAERTPRGIRGLWGWVTGKNRQIRKENEAEIARNQERDRAEKQETIRKQLAERRNLQRQIKLAREKQQARIAELNKDVARAIQMGRMPERSQDKQQERKRSRDRGRARGRGPDHSPN